ncbi:MAG: EVE domain-containing protein [Ignavibacteriae bacterium]|nr:MAG: EVE domain-containing protein [Ignavibacteriota bacterium]
MIPSNINKDHILSAIEEIKINSIPDNRASIDYDLEYEGGKYPPKYIITIAHKFAYGEELGPDNFNAQEAFRYLKNLGFNIIPKSKEANLEQKLYEFSQIADDLFANKVKWLQERYDYMKDFFVKENLEKLEWNDIQKLGDKIHAFKAMAIAKGNALGNINMPIEEYRKKFEYLAYGEDPIDVKIDSLLTGDYKIKYFGSSVITEIIAYVYAEEYVMYNLRDKEAVEFLGIDLCFSRGDSTGQKFLKYNLALKPLLEKYEQIVGKRTKTSLPLELDQFFSWLYENYLGKEEPTGDKIEKIQDVIDEDKINELIPAYKKLIFTPRYNELYKWKALKTFQDNWDIDAVDFAVMYEKSFAGNNNLWTGQNYFPKKMILFFCTINQEEVRNLFKNLFDETIALNERVSNFKDGCDKFILEINKPNIKQHYQNNTAVSLYLSFRYPEKYYLYKSTDFKNFTRLINFEISTLKKKDRLDEYFKFCEQLKIILENNIDLVEHHRIRLSEDCFNDEYNTMLTQDFLRSIVNYLQIDSKTDSIVSEKSNNEKYSDQKKYWLINVDNMLWKEWLDKGIATIGWDKLGSLNKYSDREALKTALESEYPIDSDQSHRSLACFEFANVIKTGDVIIAKTGKTNYIGYGFIDSDYIFDDIRESNKNVRKVNWVKHGEWVVYRGSIVTKTLTDITKYPDYVKRLKIMMGIEFQSDSKAKITDGKRNYWWLNANPNIWKIEDFPIGSEQSYTSYNQNGNKRRIYEYFTNVKCGDLVIGYESTPVKKIKAVFEITEGLHQDDDLGEIITFKIKEFVTKQIDWNTLSNLKELNDVEVMKNNQGSLFKLTESEFNAILNITKNPVIEEIERYNISKALVELFIPEMKIASIIDGLKFKKNIILQGPPGTGKTYIAKKIAYLMMGKKDESKIQVIQFHQSYSYEDFIQGFRPSENGNFVLKNGVFYEFCLKAQRDPHNDYFFVIDEINRGNLSKVFGELMMLIEYDKRGKEFAIPLTYSKDYQIPFYIPENLYLIGTMNTADRSLALVDYALRRRFCFVDLQPVYDDRFSDFLRKNNVDETIIKKIVNRMNSLNGTISGDSNLGKGFMVGHSYFCNIPPNPDIGWYNKIIENEISSLLYEYWFDNEDKAKQSVENLLN